MRIPKPIFNADKALQIAKMECTNKGIPIGDPIVIEQLRTWLIWIDRNTKGSPMIVIDQQTGEIVKFSHLPR